MMKTIKVGNVKTKTFKTLVALMLLLVSGAVLSINAYAQEKKQLIFASWGGEYQKALDTYMFIPFCKQAGAEYLTVSPVDYGKIRAMVESGSVEWDVVDLETNVAFRGARLNLYEPLDFNIINQPGIPKNYLAKYSMRFISYTTNMAWNSEVIGGKTPSTWADFWNVKSFPGKRSLQDTPYTNLEIGLMADGVALEDVYPLTEDKIDRAFAKLDQIKPHIVKWWTSGSEPAQMLAKGEIGMGSTWNTRIGKFKAEGAPLDQTYNQGIMQFASLAIPRGAKNKALAMRAINYALNAKAQAGVAQALKYGPPNLDAYKLLDEDVVKELNTAPHLLIVQLVIDDEFWGSEKAEPLYERWATWILK